MGRFSHGLSQLRLPRKLCREARVRSEGNAIQDFRERTWVRESSEPKKVIEGTSCTFSGAILRPACIKAGMRRSRRAEGSVSGLSHIKIST